MQDVFLRAMQQLSSLREPAAFGGWLAAIARRLAVDLHRKYQAARTAQAAAPGSRQSRDAFEVLDAMRSLPQAYRETLILRLVEGMTGPEIAARTGLTPESVRVNLCRVFTASKLPSCVTSRDILRGNPAAMEALGMRWI